jgi:hypothetical protein
MNHDPNYVMASREGLFLVNRTEWQKVADGHFFGVTIQGGGIYCFENAGHVQGDETPRGRILRYEYESGRVGDPVIVADRLPYNCHQVDFFDGAFYVVDTDNQRVLEFDAGWRASRIHQILPPGARDGPGHAHINSFLGWGDTISLMFHNWQRGIPSEIVKFDRDFRELSRLTLPSPGCHDIVRLENGQLLFCESFKGQIACDDGTAHKIDELYTRGLSVGEDEIAVGSSRYGVRIKRTLLPGFVTFLDRTWKRVARLYVPAAPTQIRRLDGADLSLSRPR